MEKTSISSLQNEIISHLTENQDKYRMEWQTSIGTKYLIVDKVLTSEQANYIHRNLPHAGEKMRKTKFFLKSKKKTSIKLDDFDESIKNLFIVFQSKEFLRIISRITGIKKLESDSTLYAGGLTMMQKGYYLKPHIDNSHNFERTKYRRLNLLFYLNPNWKKEYGGNLNLWNSKVSNSREIISNFNRLVIMETNKKSWHSVTEVKGPIPRFCLSTYLYTQESPTNKKYYHVTSFTGVPGQPILRLYSLLDNFLRQSFSTIFNVGRK